MTPILETRKSTLFKQFFLKVTELKNVKFFLPAPTFRYQHSKYFVLVNNILAAGLKYQN